MQFGLAIRRLAPALVFGMAMCGVARNALADLSPEVLGFGLGADVSMARPQMEEEARKRLMTITPLVYKGTSQVAILLGQTSSGCEELRLRSTQFDQRIYLVRIWQRWENLCPSKGQPHLKTLQGQIEEKYTRQFGFPVTRLTDGSTGYWMADSNGKKSENQQCSQALIGSIESASPKPVPGCGKMVVYRLCCGPLVQSMRVMAIEGDLHYRDARQEALGRIQRGEEILERSKQEKPRF